MALIDPRLLLLQEQCKPKPPTPGNAAALREAMEMIKDLSLHNDNDLGNVAVRGLLNTLTHIRALALSALAEPPRNCDKIRDWREAVKKILELKLGNGYELLEWLFSSAEEGVAK